MRCAPNASNFAAPDLPASCSTAGVAPRFGCHTTIATLGGFASLRTTSTYCGSDAEDAVEIGGLAICAGAIGCCGQEHHRRRLVRLSSASGATNM